MKKKNTKPTEDELKAEYQRRLDKWNNAKSLVDLYPESKELFPEIYTKLINESDRGAILIGAAYAEGFLEDFIHGILPRDNKQYKGKLLNYPGPISSFSSKIELLYAFRYMSSKNYETLNIIRKIRNKAAHEKKEFFLHEHRESIIKAFSTQYGDGARHFKEKAISRLVDYLTKQGLSESKEEDLDPKEFRRVIESEFVNKKLEGHWKLLIPKLELIEGLSLLMFQLAMNSKKTLELLND